MKALLVPVSSKLRSWTRPVVFVLSGVMFLVVLAQVIFRYILEHPLPWSEELARYLMIWTACLAAADAYAKGAHVGVTLVTGAVKPEIRRWMFLGVHLSVAVLMGVVCFQGTKLALLLGDQRSPAMGLPMSWAYLAVPVGAAVTVLHALRLFFEQLHSSDAVCGLGE